MKKLLAVATLCILSAAPGARAESVVMTVNRTTALNFLRAATPYRFDVTTAGFTETFTLFNPRELRFEQGRILLKVDCRGEPIGVDAVLEPTLLLTFDRAQNAYVAKVLSLPVSVGGVGTIYLDRYIDPIILPTAFSNTLEDGIPGLTIDTVIREIKVLDDRIETRADLVFRKLPPGARTSTK